MGNARNIAFWVVLFLLILALFNLFSGGQSTMSSRSHQLLGIRRRQWIGARVSSVTLDGERVMFRGNDGQDYVTIRPEGADITDRLIAQNMTVNARPQEQSGFTTVLMTLPAVPPAHRCLDLLHEPDAGRRTRRGHGLRQVAAPSF